MPVISGPTPTDDQLQKLQEKLAQQAAYLRQCEYSARFSKQSMLSRVANHWTSVDPQSRRHLREMFIAAHRNSLYTVVGGRNRTNGCVFSPPPPCAFSQE